MCPRANLLATIEAEARESKQMNCTVDDRRRFLNGSWETFADFKKSLHAMGLVVGQSDKQNQRYRLRIQALKVREHRK